MRLLCGGAGHGTAISSELKQWGLSIMCRHFPTYQDALVSKIVLFETDPALREKTQLLLFYGHPVKDLGLKDFWDWFSVFRPSPSTV
jgi:hypothetical protein